MTPTEKLTTAIATRTPVSFHYLRPGKIAGLRTGNPHLLFKRRLRFAPDEVHLLLWQTDGVTGPGVELPGWRQFLVEDLGEVTLLPAAAPFEVADGYDPAVYGHPIAGV